MPKPIAVLISDIHYNINTLQLADASMRQAVAKANSLGVRLIVAGDLHDTKANLRAECVNAMIATFRLSSIKPIIMVGNHDKINEKSEDHSLQFLNRSALLIDSWDCYKNLHFIPYYADSNELRAAIKYEEPEKSNILIMHQGIQGSHSGDYIQDKNALQKEDVAGLRVISGHYHRRQTLELPDGGKWDYIGNPYTLGFGEANDPEKGFQVLMDDGSLEFVPTNLRKHVVVEVNYDIFPSKHPKLPSWTVQDLIWVKASAKREALLQLSKDTIAKDLGIKQAFRLDLIPTDAKIELKNNGLDKDKLFDSIIDELPSTSLERKDRLKSLWKGLCY